MIGRLGEVGPHDDTAYEGEQSSSLLSGDYYRGKITEFQSVLNAVDTAYQAVLSALSTPGLDGASYAELQESADEYAGKRWQLKATAEAINAGAAVVNAAGGRMPSLSLPGTLGVFPAVPAAAVAAIAAAVVLIAWGREWLSGVNDRLRRAQLIAAQDSPAAAAALAADIAKSDAALQVANASGLGALAPYLKWAVLGLGAFLVYRAVTRSDAR